jgi:dihydrofolate reductase
MPKVIAYEWMSLDGVVQAPSYPDEDTSGGFAHGGWHRRYLDDTAMRWVVDEMARAGGFLFGRGTYEAFAAHWPNAGESERDLAEPLNSKPKYVVSTTLAQPLGWQNTTLLPGAAAEAVSGLKQSDRGDLHLIGSPRLARTLLENDLLDELQLMIDPILLGGGKSFFPDDGGLRALRLVHSRPTSTGALLATYARE